MWKEFYAGSELMHWPLVGMLIFLASFLVVLFYVLFVMRNKQEIQHMATLPLDDDAVVGGESNE
jgi:cbb3-type cytochrome oxidase subunit 3